MSKAASHTQPADAAPPTQPALYPFPVAVVIDSREQLEYTFQGLTAETRRGQRPTQITTVRRALAQGDYSLEGCEALVAVERKSLQDCFQTIGQSRGRFVRELERLAALNWAAVVVEAEWGELLNSPPPFSKLSPAAVYRSVVGWMVAYPTIHWVMCPGRRFAEVTTFRLLERWWNRRLRQWQK